MATPPLPTFEDVLRAADAIAAHLPPTPAWSYPGLDAAAGRSVIVKHEHTQPTGAFKLRGGLALLDRMGAARRRGGLITASTGNHAQSIAYAARTAGTRAVVVLPEPAPPRKIEAVRRLGATVILHGPTMTEATAAARAEADRRGMTYVDPGDTPAIIAGHATVYLELFRAYPQLAAVYVPVGSGSGAAGACLVRDVLAPACRIVGVQSSAAPAAYESWAAGRIVTAPCITRHSGLATGIGFALPLAILADRRQGLHDFRLVTDDEIDAATRLLAREAHTLAEGAGSAALAGLLADAGRPVGAPCAVVVTGGNASDDDLRALAG